MHFNVVLKLDDAWSTLLDKYKRISVNKVSSLLQDKIYYQAFSNVRRQIHSATAW